MRRFLFLLILFPQLLYAQSTTVSGQVTDSAGQAWNSGTFQFQFLPNPNFPSFPYTWTGGTLNFVISGNLSATGGYSQSVPDNTTVLPSGSKWKLQVCSGTTPPSCFVQTGTTITGASQTLNITPPSLSLPSSLITSAYADSEVSSAVGGLYYNSSSQLTRQCQVSVLTSCSTWVSIGSGGGGGSPGNPNLALQFNNSGVFAGLTGSSVSGANLSLTGTMTSSGFITTGSGAGFQELTTTSGSQSTTGTTRFQSLTGNCPAFNSSDNSSTIFCIPGIDNVTIGGTSFAPTVLKFSLSNEGFLGNQPVTSQCPNDTTTGTTVNLLAKSTSTGCIKAGTGDTAVVVVPVVSGAGTTSNAHIAQLGDASLIFDATNSNVQGQYVVESTTTAGQGHTTGNVTQPATGCWVGTMIDNSTTSGLISRVQIEPGCSSGTAPVFQTNGTNNASQTTLNFQTSSGGNIVNGISIVPQNVSGGNEQLAIGGTLNDAGLTSGYSGTGSSGGGTVVTGVTLSRNASPTTTPLAGVTVVTATSGAVAGLTQIANQEYWFDSSDTETVTTTLTQPVKFKCAAGVTIQQTTASTSLITLGAGSSGTYFDKCGFSPPASGTAAPLITTDPANPVNNITLNQVTLNANSSTATNGGLGWVNISGGSNWALLDIQMPASFDDGIVIDNQTPTTHNNIDGVKITGRLINSADTKSAIRVQSTNSSNPLITSPDINITCKAVGRCVYFTGNGPLGIRNATVRGTALATATGGVGLWAFFGCRNCVVEGSLDDAGFSRTGPVWQFHDVTESSANMVIHSTNANNFPLHILDTNYTRVKVVASGDVSVATGLPTNGWSLTQPCGKIANSATAVSLSGLDLDFKCLMPPSSTADGIDITTSGTGNVIVDNLRFSNLQLLGVSGAGSVGVKLTDGATGASASMADTFFGGGSIKNFLTGISIGAGVNDTQLTPMKIVGATTAPISDGGTRTRGFTHTFGPTTVTLSGGTFAVTLTNEDVFTSGTSYICTKDDQTTPANAVNIAYTSGTAFTVNGTGTDVIRIKCDGF